MATRSADIVPGSAVDITAALGLEAGKSYVLDVTRFSGDVVNIALGGDPESVGGHSLFAGEPGRLVKQDGGTWFARYYNLQNQSTRLTATEASCG